MFLFTIILFGCFIVNLNLIFSPLNIAVKNAKIVEILLNNVQVELNDLNNSIDLLKIEIINIEELTNSHNKVLDEYIKILIERMKVFNKLGLGDLPLIRDNEIPKAIISGKTGVKYTMK